MIVTIALSRWASATEEKPIRKSSTKRPQVAQGQGSIKRAKALPEAEDDYDGLTAGLDGFFGKKQGHRGMNDNAKATRGVLKKVMLLLHVCRHSFAVVCTQPLC